MILNLFVAGEPKAQPRVRAFARGRHARVYTPDTADAWKQAVVLAVRAQLWQPIRGPVAVRLRFHMPRPKRLPAAALWHTTKPDADNLAKAVLDALTDAGLWSDDAQVAELTALKTYARPIHGPGCVIEVAELSDG